MSPLTHCPSLLSRALLSLIVLSVVLPSCALPQVCLAETRVVRDVEYAAPDGHSLKLDLYLPAEQSTPRPAIVFVHGGGWKNGSKNSAKRTASWMAEHGFVVVAINYRLIDVAGWPAQIDDCYAAVRWLRENAGKFHIDPHNIGAWGTSAGGHLVALMGTRRYSGQETTSSRVKAVCDWFGPSDLLSMPPNNVGNGRTPEDVANSNGAKLLRATVREVPKLARDASGLHNVSSDDASFLIMHGDQDKGVPLEQSTKLHQRLLAANVPSRLQVIKGAGHGGKLFQTEDARRAVLQFFQRTLMPVWPQGAGPNISFSTLPAATSSNATLNSATSSNTAPEAWSVVRNENIAWRKTLPETGQSTVTVWEDRIFFTTLQEVSRDSELGQNIVAWCCNANTGKTLWTREVPAAHPLRLSGCFSDSSAPPPVADGQRVCFFNASGRITCFDFQGNLQWTLDAMAVGRSQPVLLGDAIVFTRQRYMPNERGGFTHDHKNASRDDWTQLQAVEIGTGKIKWTSQCGVNMGCVPLPHSLGDGRRVIVVGRGGGHSPPEKPEGVSMIDAHDGGTIWTLPLDGFMSTMSFNMAGSRVLVFHDREHLWVDAASGKIVRRVSILDDVTVRRHEDAWATETETLPPPRKKRAIIQQSNTLAGKYHYFRGYSRPYLGRVDIDTGVVEYLQLPVQLLRTPDNPRDFLLWDQSGMPDDVVDRLKRRGGKRPATLPINQWCFAPNEMKNSRGYVVMGDARSRGSGWGHHASQLPTVVGNRLYVPVMNGTVYVIDARAKTLDERAIVAINDLGPVGKSFNRASLSFAGGRLFAHTIREVICIGGQ